MNYQLIEMGVPALEHIRSVLNEGMTLSKKVLQDVALDKGKIILGLPMDADLSALEQFTEGWKVSHFPQSWDKSLPAGQHGILVPKSMFITNVIDAIQRYFSEQNDAICVFENMSAHPSSRFLYKFNDDIFFFYNEVYHFLKGQPPSFERVEQFLKQFHNAWRCLGVLTTSPYPGFPTPKTTIEERDLTALISGISQIIVGVYDGEAFMIWERNRLL